MNKQIVVGIMTALIGLYGASWSGMEHFHEWWSYPSVITGVTMVAVGFILSVTGSNSQVDRKSK